MELLAFKEVQPTCIRLAYFLEAAQPGICAQQGRCRSADQKHAECQCQGQQWQPGAGPALFSGSCTHVGTGLQTCRQDERDISDAGCNCSHRLAVPNTQHL